MVEWKQRKVEEGVSLGSVGLKLVDGGGVMRIDGLQSSSKGRANLLASPQGVVKGFGGQTAAGGMARWKLRCGEERSRLRKI